MTKALRVREMRDDDIDAVYVIESTAHRMPWPKNILQDCVRVHFDCRVLELNDQNIVGFIISNYQESICHTLNLCIAPDFQGKGYGRFLLHDLVDSLKDTPMDSIVLEARPSNAVALHLYETLGFQNIGIKKDYYNDELGIEDAIVLQKHL